MKTRGRNESPWLDGVQPLHHNKATASIVWLLSGLR